MRHTPATFPGFSAHFSLSTLRPAFHSLCLYSASRSLLRNLCSKVLTPLCLPLRRCPRSRSSCAFRGCKPGLMLCLALKHVLSHPIECIASKRKRRTSRTREARVSVSTTLLQRVFLSLFFSCTLSPQTNPASVSSLVQIWRGTEACSLAILI